MEIIFANLTKKAASLLRCAATINPGSNNPAPNKSGANLRAPAPKNKKGEGKNPFTLL